MLMSTPGRDTVARDVRDVSEPAAIRYNHIDKVSTDCSTRKRSSEELKFARLK